MKRRRFKVRLPTAPPTRPHGGRKPRKKHVQNWREFLPDEKEEEDEEVDPWEGYEE